MPANRKGLIMLEEVEKKKKNEPCGSRKGKQQEEYGGVSRRHFREPSRFGMKLGT